MSLQIHNNYKSTTSIHLHKQDSQTERISHGNNVSQGMFTRMMEYFFLVYIYARICNMFVVVFLVFNVRAISFMAVK